MADITLAVKYCGGCNASYDRPAMVERIRREFPGVTVVSAEHRDRNGDDDPVPDLVLVACGCPCTCASHSRLHGVHGKIITACEGDFTKVWEALKKIGRRSDLLGFAGILANNPAFARGGLAIQRELRAEWDRKWDNHEDE